MEVQGCNRKRMSSESSKGKVRLQIGILNIINVCKMDLCVHSSQMFQYKEENAFHKQSMQSTDQKCFRRLCYFCTGVISEVMKRIKNSTNFYNLVINSEVPYNNTVYPVKEALIQFSIYRTCSQKDWWMIYHLNARTFLMYFPHNTYYW